MGFWGRLFGAPPPAVVADQRALVLAAPRDADIVVARADGGARPERYAPIEQPGSTVWRTYPEESITPERWRGIQKQADLGETHELMELYDAVAVDYQVATQLRTRKLAISGAPVAFEPGDDSPLGKTVAEETAKAWQKIPCRSQLLVDMMDDFFRGFSCARPIWDSVNGQWLIVGHAAIESRYFRFINATTPIICSIPGGFEGVPVPAGYFYSEFHDKAGPVVRAGAGRSVTRSWMYKGYALIDTASFIERYATPGAQVKTDRTLQPGDPGLQQAKDAARAFIVDRIAIMPAGTSLELLQAINNAATTKDVYLAWIDFHDKAISKAIAGQTSSADMGPGGLGHGGEAEQQGEVRQDLTEADAERMGQVVDAGFSRPFALYHYGPNAPAARCVFDVAKPEDEVQATLAQKQRAETINILRSSGLRIKARQQYADFELEEPVDIKDDDELAPPAVLVAPTQVGDPSGTIAPPKGAKPAPPAAQ